MILLTVSMFNHALSISSQASLRQKRRRIEVCGRVIDERADRRLSLTSRSVGKKVPGRSAEAGYTARPHWASVTAGVGVGVDTGGAGSGPGAHFGRPGPAGDKHVSVVFLSLSSPRMSDVLEHSPASGSLSVPRLGSAIACSDRALFHCPIVLDE